MRAVLALRSALFLTPRLIFTLLSSLAAYASIYSAFIALYDRLDEKRERDNGGYRREEEEEEEEEKQEKGSSRRRCRVFRGAARYFDLPFEQSAIQRRLSAAAAVHYKCAGKRAQRGLRDFCSYELFLLDAAVRCQLCARHYLTAINKQDLEEVESENSAL